jgi:hypothetical protein
LAGGAASLAPEVLHWKGRFTPPDFEFEICDVGEELVEIRNRDVDRRIPLLLEPRVLHVLPRLDRLNKLYLVGRVFEKKGAKRHGPRVKKTKGQ